MGIRFKTTEFLSYEAHKDLNETKRVLDSILKFDSLAIIEKSSIKCIGSFGLIIEKDCINAEFGYVINRLFCRQGYMSEVLETLIPFIFENTKIQKLTAAVNSKNIASSQLLIKNNFNFLVEKKRLMEIKQDMWNVKIFQKEK